MQQTSRMVSTLRFKEVMMFGGTIAEIATEYGPGVQLCDGTNNTPNLKDRFIVGASQDDAGVAKTTVTGSPQKYGDGQLMEHDHDYDKPSQNGTVSGGGTSLLNSTTTIKTGKSGTGTKNVAVFYALCFITRTADWA